MTVCGKCGKGNPEGSGFCNSCGSRLEPGESVSSVRTIPGDQPCPRCGSPVPPYMDFCPSCVVSLKPLRQVSDPERRCPQCGRTIEPGSTACAACGDGHDNPSETVASRRRDRPVIVGILLVGTCLLAMLSSIMFLSASEHTDDLLFVDVSGFLTCCGLIVLFAAIVSLVGAVLSFRRSRHTLVVVAAAFGMLGMGPFFLASLMSMVALVIAAISTDDYDS